MTPTFTCVDDITLYGFERMARLNRVRNVFTVEVLRPGAWEWEAVGETGALPTYEAAEAVARKWVNHQTRARVNVRPNTRTSVTVAEGFMA